MTEKQVVYALKKYKYYERRRTMMCSLNYEEINSCFEKEMKRLYNETGLVIIQYELGKWNMKKSAKIIRGFEKGYDGQSDEFMRRWK